MIELFGLGVHEFGCWCIIGFARFWVVGVWVFWYFVISGFAVLFGFVWGFILIAVSNVEGWADLQVSLLNCLWLGCGVLVGICLFCWLVGSGLYLGLCLVWDFELGGFVFCGVLLGNFVGGIS